MESDVAAKELGKLIVDVSDLIKKLAALKDISTEDFAGAQARHCALRRKAVRGTVRLAVAASKCRVYRQV